MDSPSRHADNEFPDPEPYGGFTESRANLLRYIFDGIPVLLWSVRPDGVLESINKEFLEFTSLTVKQILQHGWLQALEYDALLEMLDQAVTSGIE